MQRRTGLTLVEVLVAIFIMGIGLIALLTLFPIGILRMAQAIRDERTAQAGLAAGSIATLFDVRNDVTVNSAAGEPDLFANPGALLPPPALQQAPPYGESYPVLADPVGNLAGFGDWVGGIPGYLRRRSVSFVAPSLSATLPYFKVWDDVTFDSVFDPTAVTPATTRPGTPKVLVSNPLVNPPLTIQREPRYSWAYLLRRPHTQDRSVVDCSVVVFDKRTLITRSETVYQNLAFFDPIKNTVLVETTLATTVPPNIRPGDWLYDGTLYSIPATATTPVYGSAHGYFYRVVSAQDVSFAGRNFAKYEVQTPIRGFTSGASKGRIGGVLDPLGSGSTVYPGTVIVMEGVAEVFEKGPVQAP